MKRLCVLLLVVLLSACGAAPEAAPTAVPTLVPLDKIDLVAILSSTTTLPKGLSSGQPTKGLPKTETAYLDPNAVNAASQPVLHDQESAGSVVIAIYPNEAMLNSVYSARKQILMYLSQQLGDTTESIPDLGKQSIATT